MQCTLHDHVSKLAAEFRRLFVGYCEARNPESVTTKLAVT